jgi:hypothetical protein
MRNELAPVFGDEMTEASAGQSITAALKLLEVCERGGVTFLHGGLDAIDRLLAQLGDLQAPATDWLHFFQVWGHVRNASASNLAMGRLETGAIPDLKLAYTGHYHFPHFIQAACDLIEAGPGGQRPGLSATEFATR